MGHQMLHPGCYMIMTLSSFAPAARDANETHHLLKKRKGSQSERQSTCVLLGHQSLSLLVS